MSYNVPKKLLSTKNAKTSKGEKKGYTTYIMYLAPYTQNSKSINMCSHASAGCAAACLFGSGAARFPKVQEGKTNKTEYFLADRVGFLNQLANEIAEIERIHDAIEGDETIGKNGNVVRYKKYAIRLNGTSDWNFEKHKIKDGKNIFELFPNVQFYDYTKNHLRFDRIAGLKNYHLTFSRSETNDEQSEYLLKRGFNVAYVFDNVPSEYKGFKVISGDETDLRFLDEENVIIGLKYKKLTGLGGKEKNATSMSGNFVIKLPKVKLEMA